ncbi:glutathione peroxidase [Candidatus Latescibacterota bacterium]
MAIIIFILVAMLPYSTQYFTRLTIHNFVAEDMDGNDIKFEQFKGKVILIVNTATECGLTDQFFSLQKLYNTYRDKGFEIIAFPSNSFNQEPRSTSEVIAFCSDNYLAEFKIFKKIDIKGKYQASIYKFLTEEETNPKFSGEIKWNFEKFIIGKNGEIHARFDPDVDPLDQAICESIEEALEEEFFILNVF